MKATELLEKYPLSTEVVREWFMQKMIESVRGDDEVPEDFKNFMLEQGIDNNRMATIIDSNPRMLFDVFDENDIIIIIGHHENFGFNYAVCEDEDQQRYYKTRKEAESFAIEVAFEILENKLTPAPEQIEVKGEEIIKE